MKKLVNKKELRDKMNIAIDMLSSVKVTLGPKGENVIINQSLCSPFITNDGVTIASNIESDDIVVNTILELAKEASIKTLETAGDGTTTTLVLLEELYKEGVKLVDNKVNPIIIREQLNTESQKVVNLLDKYSKTVNYHASPNKDNVRGLKFYDGRGLFHTYEEALEYARQEGCSI